MPHQCVHCGNIYADAAPELLAGCKCGSKFFYYIKQEKFDELNQIGGDIMEKLESLEKTDKLKIERDIREIAGMNEEPERPIILDLESIRVLGPGKFEIDVVNIFSKNRPIIYKIEEGKYVIDLTSTYKHKTTKEEIFKKIKNPGYDAASNSKEKTEPLESEEG